MRKPPVMKMRSYLSIVIAALVRRGLGVGIVDPFTAEEHERAGGIVRPLNTEERFEYSVIKPIGEKLSPECEALVEIFERLAEAHRHEPG